MGNKRRAFVVIAQLVVDVRKAFALGITVRTFPIEPKAFKADWAIDVGGGFIGCAQDLHGELLIRQMVRADFCCQAPFRSRGSQDRCIDAGRSWCRACKANMLERYAL